MALSAEIRDLLGIKMLEGFGECFEIVMRCISHVLLRTGMASFAIQTRNNPGWLEFFTRIDSSAVAIEAGASLPDWQLATHGLSEIVRSNFLITWSDSESFDAGEKTDHALVEVPILLKHPGL